jgi:hypothetical protein
MKLAAITLAIFCIIVPALAQTSPVPKFDQFPSQVYDGPVGHLDLSSPNSYSYRTRLRNGAQQPVNFAGHYQLAQWGCGTECITGAMIDALTGQVTFLPTITTEGMEAAMDANFNSIAFRVDSRLIVFSGQLNETGVLGTHFYLWNGSAFQHIATVPFVPPATVEAQQPSVAAAPVVPTTTESQQPNGQPAVTVTNAATATVYLDKLDKALDNWWNALDAVCRGEPGGLESDLACDQRSSLDKLLIKKGCVNVYPARNPSDSSYWKCGVAQMPTAAAPTQPAAAKSASAPAPAAASAPTAPMTPAPAPDTPAAGSSEDATTTSSAASAPPAASCEDDWTKCKDNEDLVNDSIRAGDARHACEDQVAKQVKYGDPKWCSGWFCEDFDKFRVGDDAPKTGILVLVDDTLQVQNAFGAYAHVTATCTYDLKAKSVLDLAIDQQ